jgi:hypothetical protein
MTISTISEAVVDVVLAVVFLWPVHASLRAIVLAIPRRYTLFCLGGMILLLGGQIVSRGEATYPLTDWNMYTVRLADDPRFIDYMGELSSGRETRLLIGRLFPAGGRHFRARIDKAAFAIARTDSGSPDQRAIDDLDAMLASLARAYTLQHPGESVRKIRLWSATVPARDYKGPASISRQLLREYRVP